MADIDYRPIAQSALATGSFALGPDETLWCYDPRHTIWRPDLRPPSMLHLIVDRTLEGATKARHRNEVRQLVLHAPALPQMEEADPRLVPFDNGVYDPWLGTFEEHDPRHWITSKLPWDYEPDPDAMHRHPKFDAFLAEVFEGYEAQIAAVWQIIGYSLLPSNPLQKAVWFYGPTGRNGKGTLLELIRRIVGRENASTVALREMATSVNRFKLAEMNHKMVNIDFDASGAFISDTTTFLQVTANEPTTVERKNGQPFLLTPPGLFLAASNVIPGVRDAGPAYFERWYPIYFPNSFAGHTDPHLADKLAVEIPYIIQTALEALGGVLAHNDFVQTLTSGTVRDVFAARSDNVRAWLDDRTVVDPKAVTGITRLYQDYELWARMANNGHKLERLTFKDRLDAIAKPGLRFHTVNGYGGWTLTIRSEESEVVTPPALDLLRGVDVPPPMPSMAELWVMAEEVAR